MQIEPINLFVGGFGMMRDYLSSEEGQKDYEEWQAKKQTPQLNNNSKIKEEPH